MATEEKKFLGTAGVQQLITNTRAEISAAEQAAKDYANSLADNYDAAGTAATKVNELANGQVKTNAEAIEAINNADTGLLKQAKDYADGKSAEVQENVDKNAEAIGTMDNLETTAKSDLVAAINEVRNAVSAGGTAAAITVEEKTSELGEGVAKAYVLKQGENTVGTINIPKDMVVQSGEVVTNPEGQEAGTYIKLVLANATNDIIYVNVGTLVDIYKAKTNATQIQLAIDSATREISATIVAGSVTATELAVNAVTTEKIADNNVTKAKLSAEVQASLDKADVAEQNAKNHADELNTAMDERMDAVEAMLAGDGEGTVDEKIEAAKQAAIDAAAEDATTKAGAAETNAKGHADDLNTAMDKRVQAVEGKAHEHANEDELNLIQTGDVAKWNSAQANAEATAAGALSAAKTELEGKITEGDEGNKALIDAHAERIEALETKVGDGFVEITADEIDAMFAQA